MHREPSCGIFSWLCGKTDEIVVAKHETDAACRWFHHCLVHEICNIFVPGVIWSKLSTPTDSCSLSEREKSKKKTTPQLDYYCFYPLFLSQLQQCHLPGPLAPLVSAPVYIFWWTFSCEKHSIIVYYQGNAVTCCWQSQKTPNRPCQKALLLGRALPSEIKKEGVATTHRCSLRCLTQLGFEAFSVVVVVVVYWETSTGL